MDSQGMYPVHPCKKCGKDLGGGKMDGSYARPAELYAGTYTGLCYSCQNSGPYLETTFFDGIERWNFPPHCPSWRRDRETYVFRPGCDCEKGRRIVSRHPMYGGSYFIQCEQCSEAWANNPIRKAYGEWQSMPYKVVKFFQDKVNAMAYQDVIERAKADGKLKGLRKNSKAWKDAVRELSMDKDYWEQDKWLTYYNETFKASIERARAVSQVMCAKLESIYGNI